MADAEAVFLSTTRNGAAWMQKLGSPFIYEICYVFHR